MSHDELRRRRYLQAMGIVVWERRPSGGEAGPQTTQGGRDAGARGAALRVGTALEAARQALRPTPIPPVRDRASPAAAAEVVRQGSLPADDPPSASIGAVQRPGWAALEADVAACTACGLQASRTQTVFGVGNRDADWLVIGEAPGSEEDRRGEPFVGRAGKLLNEMLRACGLRREDVYIANILKCRPPGNRDPRPEEVTHCERFLLRQIALIRPRLILAVGRIAAQNLLHTASPIGELRGRVHRFGGPSIPLVVTYHPAYLLRSPREKRRAWQDLRLAMEVGQGGDQRRVAASLPGGAC